jgi:hypothetical protein
VLVAERGGCGGVGLAARRICWFVTVRVPELNGLLLASIMAAVRPFSEYPEVGLRSGCRFVNKKSLDND